MYALFFILETMAPQKIQIISHTPIYPSLDCNLKFAKKIPTYCNKRVFEILQWADNRDIETLKLLRVLDSNEAWEEFKNSTSFHKEKFTLLLSIYLKVHLWLSVD